MDAVLLTCKEVVQMRVLLQRPKKAVDGAHSPNTYSSNRLETNLSCTTSRPTKKHSERQETERASYSDRPDELEWNVRWHGNVE